MEKKLEETGKPFVQIGSEPYKMRRKDCRTAAAEAQNDSEKGIDPGTGNDSGCGLPCDKLVVDDCG